MGTASPGSTLHRGELLLLEARARMYAVRWPSRRQRRPASAERLSATMPTSTGGSGPPRWRRCPPDDLRRRAEGRLGAVVGAEVERVPTTNTTSAPVRASFRVCWKGIGWSGGAVRPRAIEVGEICARSTKARSASGASSHQTLDRRSSPGARPPRAAPVPPPPPPGPAPPPACGRGGGSAACSRPRRCTGRPRRTQATPAPGGRSARPGRPWPGRAESDPATVPGRTT